ncbi:hypothetical protein FB451DRAFT_1207537 [Mycena latifolia]|nr:hypothetical protein FB451DRAFT_1207537 [Mycena latifolia]
MRIPSIPQRIPAPRVLIDRTGRASAQGLLSLFAALVFGLGFGLVHIRSLPIYCVSATCCYIWLIYLVAYLLISLLTL